MYYNALALYDDVGHCYDKSAHRYDHNRRWHDSGAGHNGQITAVCQDSTFTNILKPYERT